MIIAIDFDGTIVSHAYPRIGMIQREALGVISRLLAAGHWIIIWTCRDGKELTDVAEFFVKNGFENFIRQGKITFNENANGLNFNPKHKVYSDVYIDDRQWGGLPMTQDGQVDWLRIEHGLVNG